MCTVGLVCRILGRGHFSCRVAIGPGSEGLDIGTHAHRNKPDYG